ncbi:hypothetical protein pb186bvf_008207 [Paramecium bursaria]
MGNQANNNLNVNHLTNDPQYQQILRDLYANNPRQIIQDYPQYLQNQDQHPARFNRQLEIKKTVPIQNDLYFIKNSLKFQQLDLSAYQLQFKFSCKERVQVKVHMIAKETIDSNFITQKIDCCITNQQDFEPGDEQFYNNCQLDIRNYQIEQLTNIDINKRFFPLIILLISQTKKVYQYCYLKILPEELKIEIRDVKIERKGKAYSVKDIYGRLNESDDKECVICLTNKISALIIPCKHMCLCQMCCNNLMQRSSKCPICRNKIESFRVILKS